MPPHCDGKTDATTTGAIPMQHVQNGVKGFRCLAVTYGDSVLVAALIIAAISGAVLLADMTASM